MSDFEYTTLEQQIQKLKSQHLMIEDDEMAIRALRTYGYYNIINGYRDPYITRTYSEKTYSPDVFFEQIFSLFSLDRKLRYAVLFSMIDFEEHLRAVIAEIIGESFGTNHELYLAKTNYRDRPVRNKRFTRDKILGSLTDIAEHTYKEPVKYYREKHHIIPPWILLKATDLGTLINYVKIFLRPQREALIKALYSIDDKSDMEYSYSRPYASLNNSINTALSDYCAEYPDDISRIENALGCKIQMKELVFTNTKTKKIHLNPHCSGGMNLIKMPFDSAIENNYIPCKRCFSDIN